MEPENEASMVELVTAALLAFAAEEVDRALEKAARIPQADGLPSIATAIRDLKGQKSAGAAAPAHTPAGEDEALKLAWGLCEFAEPPGECATCQAAASTIRTYGNQRLEMAAQAAVLWGCMGEEEADAAEFVRRFETSCLFHAIRALKRQPTEEST